MTTFTVTMSAEPGTLSTLMPSFSALTSPSVPRDNGVTVTGVALSPLGEWVVGELASSDGPIAPQPPRARRKVTPTATTKVVRFISYPSRRGRGDQPRRVI